MFSDSARAWKIVVTLGLMVALGLRYTAVSETESVGYIAAIRNPESRDGAALLFPLWQVTHIRDADVYEISKAVNGVPVLGPTEGLVVGDTVTIKGRFRAQDHAVIETSRIDHPLRPAKGMLSLFALVFFGWCAPRFFSWTDGRVVLRG